MRYGNVLFFVGVLASASAVNDAGAQPQAVPPEFLVGLDGSPAALARENDVADQWQLRRFKDSSELRAAENAGVLVPICPHGSIVIADDIGSLDMASRDVYQFARPWVAWFLDDLVADPSFPKGATFKVTSLVRSEAYQALLLKVSLTAASGTTPQRRSSHLTGSTVDITTKDMPEPLKAWMRRALVDLERRGLVQATEEKWGALCFHIMVFPAYQKGTVSCSAACRK